MSSPWQDFGQRVDLTARIREILLDYPEGTSIFKELIQVCCTHFWRIRPPQCGTASEGSRATHTCQLLAKYACMKVLIIAPPNIDSGTSAHLI